MEGDLTGSWNKVPKDIISVCWAHSTYSKSLAFFSGQGFHTMAAAYYDTGDLDGTRDWLEELKKTPGQMGIIYTTWENDYTLLEEFGDLCSHYISTPTPTNTPDKTSTCTPGLTPSKTPTATATNTPTVLQVQVFPNPAKQQVSFNFIGLTGSASAQILIWNIAGHLISRLESEVTPNQTMLQWQTSGVGQGMYLYKIYLDKSLIKTGKLFVNH
jgi:hypothetical protein